MGTITSRLQASEENQFVDIESSDSGPPLSIERQESWDTVDFLSSISDASAHSQFSGSSSQVNGPLLAGPETRVLCL